MTAAKARQRQIANSRWFWINNIPAGFNVKIYIDGTDTYTCVALPGAQLTDAKWRVFKTTTNGDVSFADDSFDFNKQADDLAQVKTYTYLT